jgi:hypothetical protein
MLVTLYGSISILLFLYLTLLHPPSTHFLNTTFGR